ncbi:MAG TPA: cobalt ABC transporter ATP-binding protein, partial [Aeromicrobium sp.]|nr:cobalt ABC transporter ATP-binding protein [Aeromicrobium sp.]
KQRLAAVLRDLAADGHGVVLATHDAEFVAIVADDAVVLAEGEVVSRGTAEQVLAESPAFAPQVSKVLGPQWLTVAAVAEAIR